MIAIKKITLTFICFLFLVPVNAQEKGDLGILITTSNQSRLGIEYRKPIAEKYKLRIGASYGEYGNQFWGNGRGEIIAITDSSVTERFYYHDGFQAGLRLGAERQFGNSMFSVAADVSVDYRQTNSAFQNNTLYLQENGMWDNGPSTTIFPPFSDPSNSRITRHYLVSGARLSLNMNIPIGKSFLLNLAASGTFDLPVYMGASQVQDPTGDFTGIPPSWINLDTNVGIGIRYIFGSRN